ncbi:LamG-like jellyroll fold domain-containing protein [Streptomyces sp. NPDC055189]
MTLPEQRGVPADTRMAAHLTLPFAPGAARSELLFLPGATTTRAEFEPYGFSEHLASFGVEPVPRYVVRTRLALHAATTLTVAYDVAVPGGGTTSRTVELTLPAGTLAGASFLVPLPDNARPAARLRSLTTDPPVTEPAATVADMWSVTALLGELAALCWILGAERDLLTTHMALLRGARTVRRASGGTLDRIGADLGVPRFPPLPYVYEPHTLALYHLDERFGSAEVADAFALYGGVGHPGMVDGAVLGVPGRFGTAAGFGDLPSEITVADHPEFAMPVGASLTAECMVRPDSGIREGTALSKHADPAAPAQAGWALSVGGFGRGVERNVRLLLADGTRQLALFTDLPLGSDRYHHLAGVVDGVAREARLYVDGTLCVKASIDALGPLTTTAPLRIGRSGSPPSAAWHGAVDEVRISATARTSFNPVLGESDASYRRRLTVFRHWTLPDAAGLQAAVNTAAGPILGVAQPFTVDDSDHDAASGSLPVTVTPRQIPSGGSIDAAGRRDRPESEASGSADDDRNFDPSTLVTVPSSARLAFAGAPDAPPRMRVGVRRALLALVDRLTAAGAAGALRLRSGYDPAADDLRAVGRALLLLHDSVPPPLLAAMAQQAGFSWVRNLGSVYASVSSTSSYDVRITSRLRAPAAHYGADLLVAQIADIALDPPPPPGSTVRWSMARSGRGRAEFLDPSGNAVNGPWSRPTAELRAAHPGRLVLLADVRIAGRTLTALRTVAIGVRSVSAGRSIAADGAQDVPEPQLTEVADPRLAPSHVITVDDTRLGASDVAARRMHPALAIMLSRWLDALASDGATGLPRLTSGWRPMGSGPETVGRALTLERGTCSLPLDRMGALAHATGFDYVANTGTALRIALLTGNPVTVEGPTLVAEASTSTLRVRPRALPCAAAAAGDRLIVANPGTDTVSVLGPQGRVDKVVKVGWRPVGVAVSTDASVAFTADRAGATLTVLSLGPEPGPQSVRSTVPLPAEPVALAHSTSRATVAVALADRLVLCDSPSGSFISSLLLPAPPVGLALSPSGATAWIALANATLVSTPLSAPALSASVALPGAPGGITATAGRVYVTIPGNRALCILDPATGVLTTVPGVGGTPTAVGADPSGPGVYVADPSTSRVLRRAADGSALSPGVTMSTVGTPVALAGAAGRLYVVTRADDIRGGADAVGVVDAAAPLPGITTFWPLGTGDGEQLRWSLRPVADAEARLDAVSTPVVSAHTGRAGALLAVAEYRSPDHPPFSLRIGLHPELRRLEETGTPVVVRKDQYDLVMNVLHELHPIGVEVDTRVLRAHVVELRAGLLDVFPAYTYPAYRQRVRPSARPQQED